MGQKLEKLSEKDEESLDNSDLSEQTGDTQISEPVEQDDRQHQEDACSALHQNIGGIREINVSNLAGGQPGELAVTPARTDPQTGQPIRPPRMSTSGGWAGGDRQSAARTVGKSKTVLSPKEAREASHQKQRKVAAWTAMEGNQDISESDCNKFDPETKTRDLTASFNTPNEEDFVLLERDETWMPSEAENNVAPSHRSRTTEEKTHIHNDEQLHPPSRVRSGSFRRSSPPVCLNAEVTGSRCQLKGVSHAAHSETSASAKTVAHIRQEPPQDKSKNQGKEEDMSGFVATESCHQNKFAGAVSKRAKAGGAGSHLHSTRRDSGFDKVRNSHPQETPPLQHSGSPSMTLERRDSTSCPPRACDADREIANLKKETEPVCYSAVVTPPPLTHVLPQSSGSNLVSCNSTESMQTEKLRVKGPPPPVPRKPRNPFIKLKTAQLMTSGDVQRRGKDHLRSEERVKRRHTFHFNKDPQSSTPANQDMCLLWDERGTYTLPTNFRRLSADLSPWEQLSLEYMDEQYGDMIDYDYCIRMAQVPQEEEEAQSMDMLQRRMFLERRSRFKYPTSSSVRKNTHPFASTETLPIPDVPNHNQPQSQKCSLPPERVSLRSNSRSNSSLDLTDHSGDVGSYKPVAEIVKAVNQVQKQQVKADGPKAEVRLAEQSSSVKVSQMKNAFDVPKKSKVRPAEVQAPPKKGKTIAQSAQTLLILSFNLES